ncbi:MAG TPA: uridine kinase [Verrucomicrobiae bacterium]|jgi:uridine kinase|nr:uridine kinase [Verrucomicrobiae bacterium]
MQAESSQIVGIVGGSCAGKSWLAERLQQALPAKAARLSQDDFYRDRSHLSSGRRARLNFDHPRAIDWARLEQVLLQVTRGKAAAVPRYDFVTHGRLPDEIALGPAPIVIVEGLWLFRRAAVRNLFLLKVFIRSSNELCIERRLHRDTLERGRTREQVLEQLHRYTLPMFERFVSPQEKWADVVLQAPVRAAAVDQLAATLQKKNFNSLVGI